MHPHHITITITMAEMEVCACAPTSHRGSFRCRLHRAGKTSNEEDLSAEVPAQESSAAVISCLCAPTRHPGSFRCHLHCAKESTWRGRPLHSSKSTSQLSELPQICEEHTLRRQESALARRKRVLSDPNLSKLDFEPHEVMSPIKDSP